MNKWEELDKKYIWHPFTQMKGWLEAPQLVIDHGEGVRLYDTEGREYLDAISSLWVNIHGHRRKEINDAIIAELNKVEHSTLLGLINELQKRLNTAMILITHDLGVINEMADDVVVMYCGQVVEQSSARVIFTDCAMSHPYTEGLMNSIPRIDNITHKLEPIPGVVPHPLALPKGCKFAPRCKYATRKCLEEEPPLVEVVPGQKIRCFYPEKEVRNSAEHKKALIDHES